MNAPSAAVSVAAIAALTTVLVWPAVAQPCPRPTVVKVCDRPSEDSSLAGCPAEFHDGAWWVTVR